MVMADEEKAGGISERRDRDRVAVRPILKEIHDPIALELRSEEFYLADEIWMDYHETKGNPDTDRIFCVFYKREAVSVARCRRHADSYEVDEVFTPGEHRGHGYAALAVAALVEACHNEDLYMYSVSHLKDFYSRYGFSVIPEDSLPQKVRERYQWAIGNLGGAGVEPMFRTHTYYI